MRGTDPRQEGMFRYVSPEARVPKDHPLRPIREMGNRALEELSGEFEAMYSHTGWPSIAPEQLLRALLLQVLYSIRSKRLLVEQLDYNLLFRWFVGLSMDEAMWEHSTFTKNRERLIGSDIAREFFAKILVQARDARLLSDEHFSVDGTLLEAWASMKSFRPKAGEGPRGGGGHNAEVDFRGEKRSNATHESTTDPQARQYRKGKGQEAKLCYLGHALMDNRHGLIVDTRTTQASGRAERELALAMIEARCGKGQLTVGADKGYDTRDFVEGLRWANVSPHVAQNDTHRRSAIDRRTTRHAGYAQSQRVRKRIEEAFGWAKTVGGLRKLKHRGLPKVDVQFILAFAAYNYGPFGGNHFTDDGKILCFFFHCLRSLSNLPSRLGSVVEVTNTRQWTTAKSDREEAH